ncbi:MAG: hypothetical protein GF330_12550 [Candidatus Eisenbacteria bacterium]|nr:hypothetical protein [Candidatus Eisenbacteria bacterium]
MALWTERFMPPLASAGIHLPRRPGMRARGDERRRPGMRVRGGERTGGAMPENGFTAEEMEVLLPIFLDSGREYVVQLREGSLRLRNLQADGDSLGAMHRAVHSLKGAALQIGFDEIGTLASSIEDLIEHLQTLERVPPESIDLIDEGAATLTEQLDAVEARTPRALPDGLLERLQALARQKRDSA